MMDHNEILRLIPIAKSGDESSMQELLESNTPLIKSVVRRFLSRGVEYDDLFQLGSIGFVKAVRNFDTSFGVKFSTYAVPMIAGEIKRFLRDDGSIKVSRSIRSQCGQINHFIAEYESVNNEKPSIAQISEKFLIDEQEVVFIMDSSKSMISLYSSNDDENGSGLQAIERLSVDNSSKELLDKMFLNQIISTLTDKEKIIIYSRFFEDKTQSEVAKVLGVSQVQVSRLEYKILENLKNRFSQ